MPVSVEKLLNESNRMGEFPLNMFLDEFDDPTDCSDSGLEAIPPETFDEDDRGGGRGTSFTLLIGSSSE